MLYVRVTIYGDLAKRLKEHVSREWSSSRGAQALVIKRALKEYLDREEVLEKPLAVSKEKT